MKTLTIMTLSIFSLSVFATENLGDMKRMANDSISRELSTLQSNKTCINGAKTVESFKACKYDMDENMKVQKEEEKVMEKKVDSIEQDSMLKKGKVMEEEEEEN